MLCIGGNGGESIRMVDFRYQGSDMQTLIDPRMCDLEQFDAHVGFLYTTTTPLVVLLTTMQFFPVLNAARECKGLPHYQQLNPIDTPTK